MQLMGDFQTWALLGLELTFQIVEKGSDSCMIRSIAEYEVGQELAATAAFPSRWRPLHQSLLRSSQRLHCLSLELTILGSQNRKCSSQEGHLNFQQRNKEISSKYGIYFPSNQLILHLSIFEIWHTFPLSAYSAFITRGQPCKADKNSIGGGTLAWLPCNT